MPALAVLFACSIFASAFLLFQVQPMVGKRILPWFGGVPAVWTLCLAFYQLTLFLGYGYAHLLARHVSLPRQPWVHAALLIGALVSLPVLPGADWKPGPDGAPSFQILAMLAANVGLPFLFLSASGPLLQAWFTRVLPDRSPYGLYAISNTGSLLALLSYPFVFEPNLALSTTSRIWSAGFALVGAAIVACAWLGRRGVAGEGANQSTGRAITPSVAALWILLPACAVVLLMGVTNEMCRDVASVPFLWVVPLAIYLVTFIVSFASERLYLRWWVAGVAAISLASGVWVEGGMVGALGFGAGAVGSVIGIYSLLLFTHGLMAHGELYRLRPAPEHLTSYYLCIAGGGALGGIFVGIGAPRLFSDYHEVAAGVILCWLLFVLAQVETSSGGRSGRLAAAWGIAAVVGAVVFVGIASSGGGREGTLLQTRSFFGVLQVVEIEPDRPQRHHLRLSSGTTIHGSQYRAPGLRGRTTAYYGSYTGVGFVMQVRPPSPRKIGCIGLGVGALAAYGRPGDVFWFYEIDPDVAQIAQDPSYFSYLRDSPAEIQIFMGDGRLSLESQARELEERPFDVLVLDAFNSDAIPVHLLTAEAFEIYDQSLAEDGVLAVHISTRNLELRPLILRLARSREMGAIEIVNNKIPRFAQLTARWVIVSRNAPYLDRLREVVPYRRDLLDLPDDSVWVRGFRQEEIDRAPLWTDDFSDVFQLLDWSS